MILVDRGRQIGIQPRPTSIICVIADRDTDIRSYVCFCVIIYYNMLKQTIWLQLSSPSWEKAEKNLPSPGFEPGSPRQQFDDFERSAMGPYIEYKTTVKMDDPIDTSWLIIWMQKQLLLTSKSIEAIRVGGIT